MQWACSSRPSGLSLVFSLQLLPKPRRRPSSLAARRLTRSLEVGNCRSSDLCPKEEPWQQSRPQPPITSY